MGLPTDHPTQHDADDHPYPSDIALPPSRTNTFESPGDSPSRPSTDAESQLELATRHRSKRSLDVKDDRPADTQISPSRDRSRPNGKQSNRVCAKCGGHLTGQFVRALGGTYHLECFTCHVRTSESRTSVQLLTMFRTAAKLSLLNSFPYQNSLPINTLFAKRIISADWICSAMHVEVLFAVPTLLHSTANTTSNILPALYARLSLVLRTATTNMKEMYTATTIIQPNSLNAAMAVRLRFSNSLSKSSVMVKISTGTRSVI
jgi:hypothetical protein